MANIKNLFETTKRKLDEGIIVSKPRPYLGMSSIGKSCSRLLWYQFRWAANEGHSRRLARLFNRGHREEPVIVADLERIGLKVWGDQDEIVDVEGHFKGHVDGMCSGVIEAPKTIHLAEYKTASDSKFKEMCKKKLKNANPTYYGQCQIYMKYKKLTRTLFIMINKNDDSYYVERVHYDKGYADDLTRKAQVVVLSPIPLPRAFTKTYYECKWCDYKQICHYGAKMNRNCRTCRHASPGRGGTWTCGNSRDAAIPLDFQYKGCEAYSPVHPED